MKTCRKCGSEFVGRCCKPCRAAYMREWARRNPGRVKEIARRSRINNRDTKLIRDREYHSQNRDRLNNAAKLRHKKNRDRDLKRSLQWYRDNKAKCLELCKKRRTENPEKTKLYFRKYARNRYATDPKWRINTKVSARIRASLKGQKAGRSWESLVGYTLSQLCEHLRETIPDGYTWDDYLSGILELDHKIPIAVHNFTMAEDTDFLRCWSLSNLQLLPAAENNKKKDKLEREFQPTLF